jgi:hypothetical protein
MEREIGLGSRGNEGHLLFVNGWSFATQAATDLSDSFLAQGDLSGGNLSGPRWIEAIRERRFSRTQTRSTRVWRARSRLALISRGAPRLGGSGGRLLRQEHALPVGERLLGGEQTGVVESGADCHRCAGFRGLGAHR